MTDHPESDPLVERFQRVYQASAPVAGRRATPRGATRRRSYVPLAAAAAVMLALIPWRTSRAPTTAAVDPLVTVQFVLVSDAHRVSVVGDFNGWDPDATPMTRHGGDTRWEASADLGLGRVEYAFVLDGRTWIPDPNAPLAPATEFGARNSVLTIRPQGRL